MARVSSPEDVCRWVYRRAFCNPSQPPGPAALLERLVGTAGIRFESKPYAMHFDGVKIAVTIPRGLSTHDLCMTMALAVATASTFLMPCTLSDHDVQRSAEAIVMPREAMMSALFTYGPCPERLGIAFALPPSVVVRRLRALGHGLATGVFLRPKHVRAS